VLTASTGTWTPAPTSFRYQWLLAKPRGRIWKRIKHATHSTYVPVRADEGSRISVQVTAIGANARSTIQSQATSPVKPSPPTNGSRPVIGGPARRGFTLTTITTGVWRGAGNRLAYQWQHSTKSGWRSIARARGTSYVPAKSDEGARVRLLVTATNSDGSLAAPSNATAPIKPALPLNTSSPQITGTPRPGASLQARPGSWSPPRARFAYRWQRSTNGRSWREILHADHRSYTVVQGDAGAVLRVIVTATNPDGSRHAASAAQGVPPVSQKGPATPSGTLASSQLLTADGGRWDPARVTLRYSWQRCPATATAITAACLQISTGPTYTLTAADAGYRIAVTVSASAAGGTTSVDSPVSDVVASAVVTPGAMVRAVPHSFLGLSMETNEFDQFVQSVPSFPALLRQLEVPGDASPISLRLGGDSADGTYLNADGFSPPSGVKSFAITLAYLQRLGTLARAVPLKVLLDLNLAAHNPQMAAALASEAQKALPAGGLDALEVGNEPDYYQTLIGYNWDPSNLTWGATYSPQKYAADFAAYAAALSSATPGVPVGGPAVGHNDATWYQPLLQTDGPSVGLLTAHRYPLNACVAPGSAQYPTIAGLLSPQASLGLAASVLPDVAAAHQAGIELRLGELGSVTCTGLAGVSDTFATALWAPDALFNLLADGVDAVNVHTRYATPNTALYGPGPAIVRPLFYGMVAFTRALGPGASLLQTNVGGQLPPGLSVWPVALQGGQMHVLLINKAISASTVVLQAGATTPAQVQSLQGSSMAPGAQVTFGGQELSNDGTWQGTPVSTGLRSRDGAYQVSVPPLSASLLSYKPSSSRG
jgi:hypothetical protein